MTSENKYLYLFIILICLILTIIWFSSGNLLGTGEAGLPFYYPEKYLYTNSFTWTNDIIGNFSSSGMASLPWYALVSVLKFLFGSTLSQATVFFGLTLLMAIGTVKMLQTICNIQRKPALLLASLFYICNTVALSQVFNRFQYPFIYTYAILPMWITLLHNAYNLTNKIHILYFILFTLLTTFSLSSPPMLLIIIIISLLYLVGLLIQQGFNIRAVLKYLQTSTIIIILGLLLHSWWLMPFVKILSNTEFLTTNQYNTIGNLDTYHELSGRLGNPIDTIRLQNKEFFIEMSQIWGHIYSNPFFISISFIPFLILVYLSFTCSFKFKFFFILTFITAVIVSMGSNPPVGLLNVTLFTSIRLFESFRNPFEKASLLLPISLSPFIGIFGLKLFEVLKSKFSEKIGHYFYVLFTIILCGIYVFPLWSGQVFSSTIKPSNNPDVGYQVKVPEDYERLRDFLKSKYKEKFFRTLFLPIGGEGITYNWEKGYSGIELTNDLLGIPTISMTTGGVQFLSNVTNQLEENLFTNTNSFANLLSDLRVRYLIIREDTDETERGLTSHKKILEKINQTDNLVYIHTYGSLHLYEVNSKIQKDLITISTNPIRTNTYTNALTLKLSFKLPQISDKDVFYSHNNLKYDFGIDLKHFDLSNKSNIEETYEKKIYNIEHFIDNNNITLELPYVSYLPGSPLHQLVILKEKFNLNFSNPLKIEELKQLYVAKRLHEAILVRADTSLLSQTISNYITELKGLRVEKINSNDKFLRNILVQKIALEENKKDNQYFDQAYLEVEKILSQVKEIYLNSNNQALSDKLNIKLLNQEYLLQISKCNENEVLIKGKELGSFPRKYNHFLIDHSFSNSTINLTDQLNNGICSLTFLQDTNFSENSNANSKVTYTMITPTKYVIHIPNPSNNKLITFAESFHNLWKAKDAKTGKIIPNHVLVNDFANGWLLPNNDSSEIILFFEGEKFFNIGKIISIFSGFFLTMIVVYKIYEARKKIFNY